MSIVESSDYKRELKGEVISIKRMLRKHGYDFNYFKLERFVFVSAYLIRKLIESKKISDELEKETLWCGYFKVVKPEDVEDYFKKVNIGENYNLETREEVEFKIRDLANTLIHSYIFAVSINDEGLAEEDLLDNVNHFEIFFNSDYSKDKLYSLKLPTYLYVCRKIYLDRIQDITIGRQKEKNSRVILTKSRNEKWK